jgi:hypothetical protein
MSTYYSNSPEALAQATIDQDRVWVRSAVLMTLMNELRVADISDDSGAAAALENVTSMVTSSPYQIVDGGTNHLTNIRFSAPNNAGTPVTAAFYVALFRDGWQQVFDSLVSSLTTPTTDQPTPQARIDRFYQTLYIMGIMLRNSVGIYNLRSFEQEYSLQWGTPPATFSPKVTSLPRFTSLRGLLNHNWAVTTVDLFKGISAYHIALLWRREQATPTVGLSYHNATSPLVARNEFAAYTPATTQTTDPSPAAQEPTNPPPHFFHLA